MNVHLLPFYLVSSTTILPVAMDQQQQVTQTTIIHTTTNTTRFLHILAIGPNFKMSPLSRHFFGDHFHYPGGEPYYLNASFVFIL